MKPAHSLPRTISRAIGIALLVAILFTMLTAQPSAAQAADDVVAASGKSRPNVLFIAIDDLKPSLGCYGDSQAISTSIDRLAAVGTMFTNAHCQWPVCGPSRASLMTSLRPEASGVMDLKTDVRAKNKDVTTLPQQFRSHGYTAAGCGKIYDPRCVDNKKDQDAPSWSVQYAPMRYGKLKYKNTKQVTLAPEVKDAELADGQIAQTGIKLMRKLSKEDAPFFLAVGFKKPHLPFVAPKKYWDLYDRQQFALATHAGSITNASGRSLHESPEFRQYEGVPESGEIPESVQRECLHGYYACVSFIDAQVGLLLDELTSLGLDENTIVVLWGDHGFHLGDHAMWGKHSTLEHATRSPLIIRPLPGSPESGKVDGKTASPVELSDIFPTLCELADVPTPDDLNGRSLAGLMRGDVDQVRQGAVTVFKSKGSLGYSYRTERYRYTEWINKRGETVARELYDYQTDPHEKANLIDTTENSDLVDKLAEQLRAESQGCLRLGRTPVAAATGR